MQRLILLLTVFIISTTIVDAQYIYPLAEYNASDKSIELSNFDIKDDYLYFPLGESGLHVLDISDLDNIKDVANYVEYEKRSRKKVYGIAYSVKVIDDKAYLSYGPLGLKVLSIQDPTMPFVLGTYYRHQDVYSVEIFENYAFLGYVDMGLEIVDFSDLNNIRMVSRNNVKDFTVQNTQIIPPYVIISGGNRGLKIFKFQEPFIKFEQAEFPKDYLSESEANKFILRNSTGYIANDFKGLTVLNMGLPSYPVKVQDIKTEGRAQDVISDRNYLYVATDKSVEVYDVKDPEKPVKIHEYIDKDKKFKSLKMQGTKLFASYSDGRDYGILVFQVE